MTRVNRSLDIFLSCCRFLFDKSVKAKKFSLEGVLCNTGLKEKKFPLHPKVLEKYLTIPTGDISKKYQPLELFLFHTYLEEEKDNRSSKSITK